MTPNSWLSVNRSLCAKIISELHYEELLEPTKQDKVWFLETKNDKWYFEASITIWGMLEIAKDSIECESGKAPLASQLLIDLNKYLTISDINLANLLEEVQQTLYSDMVRMKKLEGMTADDLTSMSEIDRQQYIDAHPKAIANKGRLGWGADNLEQYSPESGNPFQLRWLAIRKSQCEAGIAQSTSYDSILKNVLGEAEFDQLNAKLGAQYQDFWLVAIHPWQFQRFLTSQYACLFMNGDIVDLGLAGADWKAQQSIRTLSSPSEHIAYDAKTALSILNTSCYRGIPGKFIVQGPELSSWLDKLTKTDETLKAAGLHVQQEVAGFYAPHPFQSQLEQGPYRYQEMLGCIWRERAEHIIAEHKRPITMAALMQGDLNGKPLIGSLIDASGITIEQWLEKLFSHVVVPLYHLMCKYGVGLVAHGQNITLVLEDNIPCGCIIKDFHGDLRIVNQEFPELNSLDGSIKETLTRLPPHYLIHDLLTGHFVTVLRFISPKIAGLGFEEIDFYRLLRRVIQAYKEQHSHLEERFNQFDLMTPQIDKICINRVRFKIGYGDTNERPLPDIGKPINNPLMQ